MSVHESSRFVQAARRARALRKKAARLERDLIDRERVIGDTCSRIEELELQSRHQIQVLEAIYSSKSWRITKPLRTGVAFLRRLRGLTGQRHSSEQTAPQEHPGQSPPEAATGSYAEWLRLYEPVGIALRQQISAEIPTLGGLPRVSLIIPLCSAASACAATLASLQGQLYPKWELLIVGKPSLSGAATDLARQISGDPRVLPVLEAATDDLAVMLNLGIEHSRGEIVAFLEPGDRLAETALFFLVKTFAEERSTGVIYSDSDEPHNSENRRRPSFMPDWSPDLLHSYDYIDGLVCYRRSVLRDLGGFDERYGDCPRFELLLRISEHPDAARIRHLPRILLHRRLRADRPDSPSSHDRNPAAAERRALAAHFRRRQIDVQIESDSVSRRRRIVYPLGDVPPPVSIVVPTRDRLDLLERCIEGLLRGTDYPAYEIIVVDNNSQEPASHDYLRDIGRDSRIRVLPYSQDFNFSAINNRAAEQAKGDVLAFVNNDIEITDPRWLVKLVRHARRPEVGAAGPLLLYPSGEIQSAGILLGVGGIAANRLRLRPPLVEELPRGALVTRNLSAVSAALMVLRKDVFEEAGGFDEKLRIAFNDVDLCLRIRRLGYWIVWTADTTANHHESQSLKKHDRPERAAEFRREVLRMQEAWSSTLDADPFYNVNLSVERDRDYQLSFPPRLP